MICSSQGFGSGYSIETGKAFPYVDYSDPGLLSSFEVPLMTLNSKDLLSRLRQEDVASEHDTAIRDGFHSRCRGQGLLWIFVMPC